MSYSFSVRAATKDEAIAKVGEEFEKVVNAQPIHAKDRDAVETAAENIVAVLKNDDTRDVTVSVSGSLSWTEGDQVSYANLSINAGFAER
jgi:hypothetical protein